MNLEQLKQAYPSATSKEEALEQAKIYQRYAQQAIRAARWDKSAGAEDAQHAHNLKQLAEQL